LAARLSAKGFEPVFIMSTPERQAWQAVIGEAFPLHTFAGVDQCATFLYESGFFIGNDSGGGHLASCLDIPVLSIHGRKGKSRIWRPGWGQVEVVSPLINVVGGSLRQWLWKYFLSVGAVERGFDRLVSRASHTYIDTNTGAHHHA
jgi:heptosyltransferase-3